MYVAVYTSFCGSCTVIVACCHLPSTKPIKNVAYTAICHINSHILSLYIFPVGSKSV